MDESQQIDRERAAPGSHALPEAVHVRVGFLNRVVMVIVDALILALLLTVGGIGASVVSTATLDRPYDEIAMVGALVGIVFAYSLMDVAKGTMAKRMSHARIASIDGQAPTIGQRISRWGMKFSPLLLLMLALSLTMLEELGIGGAQVFELRDVILGAAGFAAVVVAAGFVLSAGRERRALHDHLSGTVILRDERVRERRRIGFEAVVKAVPVRDIGEDLSDNPGPR